MNLRGIDLNLLAILHVLLEEGHVTRAARRLALSQPATSAALDRCRHLFGDPLLERVGNRMRLTARGRALREPLARALAGLEAVIEPAPVDLRGIRQAVRMCMADHLALTVLTALLGRLAASAPGLDLVVLPWRGGVDAVERLARGEADLAVSVLPSLPPAFHRVELLHEPYMVAMRAGHPAARGFDLDAWLAYPHVLVSGHGETRGALDEALANRGLTRRVGVVVPNFTLVDPLLRASDLIAMLPAHCLPGAFAPSAAAGAGTQGELAVFAPPLPVPGFALHLAWHARVHGELAVRHVADEIRALLGAAPPRVV